MKDIRKVKILDKESIFIGYRWRREWMEELVQVTGEKCSAYLVLTDSNVAPLYLDGILADFSLVLAQKCGVLSREKRRVLSHVIPAGEEHKTRHTKAAVEDFMLSECLSRDTCLIALGGGVVGDLGGFVAATYMRGIQFVQVPTTLMAMIDSSIGGKTAIDTPAGKNLIGAFWQPMRVFIDLEFLTSLPARQFCNGVAEIIKAGAVLDADLFQLLESRATEILGFLDDAADDKVSSLLEIVERAVRVKCDIVSQDEKESGPRELLNYGHSIGHAIETCLAPHLLHGEAIAVGMVKEAEIARRMGHLKQVHYARLTRCLKLYRLPISLDKFKLDNGKELRKYSPRELLELMKVDKKNQGSQKRIVLLSGIGRTFEKRASYVEDRLIECILSENYTITCTGNSSWDNIEVDVPGSKSISNRAILIAALGVGSCRIRGLLHSDDTEIMLKAMQQMGVSNISWEEDGEVLVLEGSGGSLYFPEDELYLGNAGTAARFLTTVCTLIEEKHTGQNSIILSGNRRMKERPIASLVTALKENGCDVTYLENKGYFPLEIRPSGLKGGLIRLSASISSQFVSSILISAPYAQTPITLILGDGVDNHVVSRPYIDMTIRMMEIFGVRVQIDPSNPNILHIPRGKYRNPEVYHVEPDASSATYPLGIAAILGKTITVRNMGSESLQGDSRFAKDVLEKMGCTVTQGPYYTTVSGPPFGSLKSIPTIDMEQLTDAFLTASVLASVAQNKTSKNITRITGISNQRVKECNRIEAMVTELSKYGIYSEELHDGIQIHGRSLLDESWGKSSPNIDCYDDHRIAMSFSVLACALRSPTTISGKQCVEKTWPTWWDFYSRQFGLNLEPFDIESTKASCRVFRNVIVLIGMRGVGKSCLGKFLSKSLGWTFVDIDQLISQRCNKNLTNYVEENGWEKFRDLEQKILEETLDTVKDLTVIATGGGIVERPCNHKLLQSYKDHYFIVHLDRPLCDIERSLSGGSRPAFCDSFKTVFGRREPLYRSCRNYHFKIHEGFCTAWSDVEQLFLRFAKGILGLSIDERIFSRSNMIPSSYICLTYPDLRHVSPEEINQVTFGVDAVELRVDLLQSCSLPSVQEQFMVLRRHCDLPIVFTVRTESQWGKFPQTDHDRIIDLLTAALEWGADLVDLELSTLSDNDLSRLKERRSNSRFIMSFHSKDISWRSTDSICEIIRRAERFGDVTKIILYAENFDDNLALFSFLNEHSKFISKPLIAVNAGAIGSITRALNLTLTPVTHPLLPNSAAPGQLSLYEINKLRCDLNLIQTRNFYLIGSPVKQSPSPTLHNGFFEKMGVGKRFHYTTYETANPGQNVLNLLTDPSFGGASVTIPLKESIISHLDILSDAATAIGAVNTVIPMRKQNGEGYLFGDNTDWIGIYKAIILSFEPQAENSILIIGAGGTAKAACYTAMKLSGNNEMHIYNRTFEKACILAERFSAKALESIGEKHRFNIVISTIPSAAQFTMDAKSFLMTDLSLKKVYVELAYNADHRETMFTRAAKETGWISVDARKILQLQAMEQLKRWKLQ